MMNAKISQKHDNVHYIKMNYTIKYVYNDRNESINDTLSLTHRDETMSPFYLIKVKS